jgi:hypothetical protein
MKRINNRLLKFCFYFLLLVISAHFFQLLSYYFLGEKADIEYFEKNTSLVTIFFMSVFIGPLLETFVFQWLIYSIFSWIKTNRQFYIYTISSILFGLVHNYNIFTVIDALFAGLIFIHFFHINYKNSAHSFIQVFVLHASFNFYAFCFDDLNLFQL